MNLKPLRIQSWQAWAPGLADESAWRHWLAHGGERIETIGRPACKQVPTQLRRRCGQNARMVIETALAACAQAGLAATETQLIYGTANGENRALKALLEDLSMNEPLSPAAFTNSLHHVPSGYYSIATQHRGISRTISSFEDSFTCCWLEAQSLMAREDRPILQVVANEMAPPPFDEMLEPPPFPYAVAMVLAADETGLRFERAQPEMALTPRAHTEPLFDFLKWYDGGHGPFCLETAFGAVVWKR